MQIQNAIRILVSHRQVSVANILPAGKSPFTINDQQFTVIAHVEIQRGREQGQGIKSAKRNAQFQQVISYSGQGHKLTHAIDDDLHLNTSLHGGRQSVCNCQTAAVVVKDVRGQQHA